MTLAREGEVDAAVHHALPMETCANAHLGHQVNRALLEDTRADALDHMFLASVLENDGINARTMEEMTEHQPGRPATDNPDLGAQRPHKGWDILIR